MRLLSVLRVLTFGASLWAMSDPSLAQCFDLRQSAPSELSGRLVAQGPPKNAGARQGAYSGLRYVLVLPQPICVKGPSSVRSFSSVELLPTERTARFLPLLGDSQVAVSLAGVTSDGAGQGLSAAATGIAQLENGAAAAENSAPQPRTAATAVRGFYQALGAGDGAAAAEYIAPGRRSGPLSAEAMTRFYSRLSEPLRLTALNQISASDFFVSYRFKAPGRACRGRAVVRTIAKGGEDYIDNIRALDGC
ncbi:MAG TPA: hypothetical protein VKV96_14870 [Roseiarcus sp.]|nr:hypothetical protein [Roseiarcus sp.]